MNKEKTEGKETYKENIQKKYTNVRKKKNFNENKQHASGIWECTKCNFYIIW